MKIILLMLYIYIFVLLYKCNYASIMKRIFCFKNDNSIQC